MRSALESDVPSFSLVQRIDFLKSLCRERSVLHLGCTNWPYREQSSGDERFLHHVLSKSASELWGLDSDIEGLTALNEQGVENLHRADLENLAAASIDRTFDVIVAGEVIEHLSNPGLFLEGVKRFMRADTDLVITTVNAYCAFRLAIYGLRGHQGRSEPVHPDHVAYYSYNTLAHAGRRAGLSLEKFVFYDLGREHRPFARRSIGVINDLAVRFMPQLADGVIGVFRHSGQGNPT
jgi:SAM-dependent methyltransferase